MIEDDGGQTIGRRGVGGKEVVGQPFDRPGTLRDSIGIVEQDGRRFAGAHTGRCETTGPPLARSTRATRCTFAGRRARTARHARPPRHFPVVPVGFDIGIKLDPAAGIGSQIDRFDNNRIDLFARHELLELNRPLVRAGRRVIDQHREQVEPLQDDLPVESPDRLFDVEGLGRGRHRRDCQPEQRHHEQAAGGPWAHQCSVTLRTRSCHVDISPHMWTNVHMTTSVEPALIEH